jgi:hypothetical protein
MAYEVVTVFYMCPRCMEAADEPTPCPRCGGERVACRPGEADDPRRRPLMSSTGEVRSHAPLWWLRRMVVLVADRNE